MPERLDGWASFAPRQRPRGAVYLAPVTLRAEININGQTYAYQQAMPRRDWEAIQRDAKLRATVESMLRARLGATVMEQLQPPVTVHMPGPLDEAVMQRAIEELEATEEG